ncbi:MAG: hypothetical protein ABII82_02590 [Verrucomicrobiota bacterium]
MNQTRQPNPCRPRLRSAAWLMLGCLQPLAADPLVILHDAFADGERETQALPASAEWFGSSSSATIWVERDRGLVQEGGGRHVLAYFTPAREPVRLAPGQTVRLTYELAITGPMDGPSAFRVGLFDSGGARVIDDKQSRSLDFVGYRGYIGTTNPKPLKNAPLRIAKRIGESDTLLATITAYELLGGSGGSLQPMEDGVFYTGTLSIKCVSYDKAIVTHGYEGGELRELVVSDEDVAAPQFTFDTVAVHAGSKAADGFVLRSVKVELVSD